jgi:hypothetical protein
LSLSWSFLGLKIGTSLCGISGDSLLFSPSSKVHSRFLVWTVIWLCSQILLHLMNV